MSTSHLTVIIRRLVFATVFVAVVLATFMPSSRAAETQAPEEWIFSVVMPPKWRIADALFAYQYKGGYYLPVVELAEGFEFFVEAETDRAYVSGFAGREEHSFTIDGEANELIVKGERETLPSDAILPQESVFAGDIYVRLDILNEIWPVEMEVALAEITIFVTPEEELSFERRLKREQKAAIFETQQKERQEAGKLLPYRENSYKWLGKPVFDIQSSYAYDMDTRELTGANNISGSQQIGKFLADYSANYSYQEGNIKRPSSIRTRFMRRAPEGENLFVPTLKHIEFGDVSVNRRDLIGTNKGGRGVVLSNDGTAGGRREFDRITVEGRGPPGWEIELYNNNQLIRLGAVEDDGEYRFEEVVLSYGNNRIRVILYGPQGQIREEVYEYDVAGNLLSPGEFKYRLGAVDDARNFIQLEDVPSPTDPHITTSAEFNYGLNRWLTLFGSYTRTPLVVNEERYYTAGLAFSTPFGFGEIEGYRQINGGSAIDSRFITKVGGLRLNARAAFFSKFQSEEAGSTLNNNKRFEGELKAQTKLDLPLLPMNLSFDLNHQEFNDGRVATTVDSSQNFTGGGLRFNHSTNSRFTNEVHEASGGSFSVNWNKSNWQTRAGLGYSIHPQLDLSNGNAEVRYRTDDNFQAALGWQHNFDTSNATYSGQLGYDFGNILSSLDASYAKERGWRFTVRASTSLNPYNGDGIYKLDSTSQQSRAAVLGRVFLDRDSDGVFSDGDEPLEGVHLQLGRSKSLGKTDKDGYIVESLRPDIVQNIAVNEESLLDPYYSPSIDGYSTLGLVASMPGFDFPIVETGAIDGTVWREPSGKPVGGMRIQLVTEEGGIYMETDTAFDGYYAFEYVLPGTYIVRADPEYRVNVPAETVTVSSEEVFAFGIDLYLLEPVAEENAAGEPDGEGGGKAQLPTTTPAVSGTSQPAPVSPQDEGSSQVSGETSEEGPPVEAIPVEDVEGSSLDVPQVESGREVASFGISSVTDVRPGEYPDKTRLVLDLSGPASYVIEEGNGVVVLVDMPATVWETVSEHEMEYSTVLESFRTETLEGKGTRLVLKAKEAMFVEHHELRAAENGKPDRLIIDLKKK